jgi:heterodisulfide reductase subunit A
MAGFETAREKVQNIHSAKKLAFIQCVGSRDKRFNRQCSSFCCMHAIKEAIIAKEHEKESEIYFFGMDIRAVGKGFEEYKNRGGRNSGIQYIRSRVAEITQGPDGSPVVWYEETQAQKVRKLPVDLVILATACEPSKGTQELSELLGIERNDFGFFKTDVFHPLDTTRTGVFTCGCAQGPMDIPESVAQASSAAARAAQMITSVEKMRQAS